MEFFVLGNTYAVTDQNGDTRTGVYSGQEEGAGGMVFDIFQTSDRIPFSPGFVEVWLPSESGKHQTTRH